MRETGVYIKVHEDLEQLFDAPTEQNTRLDKKSINPIKVAGSICERLMESIAAHKYEDDKLTHSVYLSIYLKKIGDILFISVKISTKIKFLKI